MRPCSWVLVRGERELCATREAERVASTAGVRVPLRCPFGNDGRGVCLQCVRVREPRARATAVRRAAVLVCAASQASEPLNSERTESEGDGSEARGCASVCRVAGFVGPTTTPTPSGRVGSGSKSCTCPSSLSNRAPPLGEGHQNRVGGCL